MPATCGYCKGKGHVKSSVNHSESTCHAKFADAARSEPKFPQRKSSPQHVAYNQTCASPSSASAATISALCSTRGYSTSQASSVPAPIIHEKYHIVDEIVDFESDGAASVMDLDGYDSIGDFD